MRLHEFIKDADDQEVTELIGAVANALAKTEKDPAAKAAERKELADKIQELEAQVRELRKAQTEV